jgi:hypothetical protein
VELALCREGLGNLPSPMLARTKFTDPTHLTHFQSQKFKHQQAVRWPSSPFPSSLPPHFFQRLIALRSPLAQHASHRSRAPSAVVRSCV